MRAGECQPHARVLMGRARRARRANERCKVCTGRREREIKKAEIRKSKSSQRCNVHYQMRYSLSRHLPEMSPTRGEGANRHGARAQRIGS